jgi:hypothetical protein
MMVTNINKLTADWIHGKCADIQLRILDFVGKNIRPDIYKSIVPP